MLSRFQMWRYALILAPFLLLVIAAAAQEQRCASLQALKKQTYGFRPTKLTQQQQTLKERQIDRFWQLADSQGGRGVACLQRMLKAESSDSFFLFDGASLLLHLDDSPPSLRTVSEAAAHSDLTVDSSASTSAAGPSSSTSSTAEAPSG